MNQSPAVVFEDNLYPKKPLNHTRHTVRLLIKDENNCFLFLHLKGKDEFGKRDHYESVGGGIEPGETFEEAVVREVEEETGYTVHSAMEPLCVIEDCYYLIQRKTISHFFVVSVKRNEKGTSHPTEEETKLFNSLVWIPEEEVESALDIEKQKGTIGELVHRRDFYAFQMYRKAKQ